MKTCKKNKNIYELYKNSKYIFPFYLIVIWPLFKMSFLLL